MREKADVKQSCMLAGIPPEVVRLSCEGRTLESERTLSSYNLEKGSTFVMLGRLRGGACLPGVEFADVTNSKALQASSVYQFYMRVPW